MGIDNGFIELKALLRLRLAGAIEPRTAVAFYAGAGRCFAGLCPRFRMVHAVEKDPAKFERLSALAAKLQTALGRPALTPHLMDNLEFVQTRLGGIEDLNFLDFDAYSSPRQLIAAALSRWRPSGRAAIVATDGGRIAQVRKRRQRIDGLVAGTRAPDQAVRPPAERVGQAFLPVSCLRTTGRNACPTEERTDRNARPSASPPAVMWARPLSAQEYELSVKGFWQEQAARWGWRVEMFARAWRRERRVLYYGLIVSSD